MEGVDDLIIDAEMMMKAMLPITPQLEGQHLPQNTQTFPTKAPCAFPPVSQLPPGYLGSHTIVNQDPL